MALSRDFVSELLTNKDAHTLLAFSAHTVIPDEMYFATFGLSGNTRTKTIEGTPTWFHFTPGQAHPDWIGLEQLKTVENATLFVRKVELGNKAVRAFADQRREACDLEMGIM
jgi:Core-2/I-Branching enzyme